VVKVETNKLTGDRTLAGPALFMPLSKRWRAAKNGVGQMASLQLAAQTALGASECDERRKISGGM